MVGLQQELGRGVSLHSEQRHGGTCYRPEADRVGRCGICAVSAGMLKVVQYTSRQFTVDALEPWLLSALETSTISCLVPDGALICAQFVTLLFYRPGSATLFPEPNCCYPTRCCLVASHGRSIYQQAGSEGLCALVRESA